MKIDKLTWVHSSQSLILGDFPNKVKHSAGSHGFTENCGKALKKIKLGNLNLVQKFRQIHSLNILHSKSLT